MKFLVTNKLLLVISTVIKQTKIKKDFTFHYLYIVNKIRHAQILNTDNTSETYIRLCYDFLETTISKEQTPIIIRTLIEQNIIECDGVAIIGSKAYGYRITREFMAQKWKYIAVTDTELVGKIMRITEMKLNLAFESSDGYRTAAYWSNKITINKRNALSFVNNPKNNLSEHQIQQAKSSILALTKSVFFLTYGKTARLYTNLNCIKRGLRQFITVDGQELHGVDITSSQPLFLGILLKNNSNIEAVEYEKYMNVVCNGTLYEYLAKAAGLDIDLKNHTVRSQFKKMIFAGCLYNKPQLKLSEWELIFQSSFPTILAECRRIKEKDHKVLAQQLQRLEASFIFECVRIGAEELGDNTPITTIHDEIVSTKESIHIIEKIVRSEFSKIGIEPKIESSKL
ncbi:hypothetical protein [Flavobacterium caseinilyticum]|uniref:DNA-directed DNA polymerase family A palm domain-containing protein n=1 Tax=Flavobacterium caseinilyticum TaxID=2541732 RepID=A0A4R5B0I6_9FLAO|nr:hypothetical protein [Flavobacterium caseinilyticum]TDD78563.1 hypothetical protein E0F89_02705 [Flavobacterium caseinilyticum]